MVTVTGSYYEGTFYDAKLEGKGYFCTSSGKVIYSGEFKDGKYHGFGKLYSTKDTYYEGEFVDNKAHGFGTFWFHDKTIYRGGVVNGVLHGEAEVWLPDGRYFKARFENGKAVQTYQGA